MVHKNGKDVGGRPKILKERHTILGCVSKEYHEHIKKVAKKITTESGKLVTVSHLVRMALEAMFPPDSLSKKEEDPNQMLFFEKDLQSPKKSRVAKKQALSCAD